MNNFQGFDNQNNGAGFFGILIGLATGTASFLLGIREWWNWGWGPWGWSGRSGRSETIHAYWLAFMGHVKPSYKGDLGTWASLESWLRNRHQYDAFVASFWIPFLVGTMVGVLTAWLVVRASNRRRGATYVRGSKIN